MNSDFYFAVCMELIQQLPGKNVRYELLFIGIRYLRLIYI